ncbi:hypothetical protein BB560_006273 [Smittium megazygosporum]|uniref:Uncharacterized protein n=1 Tax=Smittium megazygosporum TaxID=133381 RepID=A0A2T9YBR4_9FUNG|nr:hypothetical protein BB560_006273 [Smittium megazygosporum]
MPSAEALGRTAESNEQAKKPKILSEKEVLNDDSAKFQRLNFLIEKSSAYASFLAKKIEKQKVDRIKRTERKERKAKRQLTLFESASRTSERISTRSGGKENSTIPKTRPDSKTTKKKESNLNKKVNLDEQNIELNETHKKTPEPEENKTTLSQPKSIVGTMKKYQLEGMDWLISLYENGLNGILADEMGLGKTLQTIAFLTFLREQNVFGPFLIVCPLSTLGNWVSEFKKFTPSNPVLLYHGLPEERTLLRKRNLNQDLGPKFPIIITTYEIVMRDSKYLKHFAWKYIVVDEGHRLKNLNCQLIKELKLYQSANRLLLTGTPLQNKLSELWSLLNFLLPDIFDDLDMFQEWFNFDDISNEDGRNKIINQETTNKIISKLHHILQPFLLRRLKSEVEFDLPPKREYIITCPMTVTQSQYYNSALKNDIRGFLEKKFAENMGNKQDSGTENKNPVPEPKNLNNSKRKAKQKAVEKIIKKIKLEDDSDFEFSSQENSDTDATKVIAQSNNNTSIIKRKMVNMNLKYKLMQLRKISNHPFLFDFPLINPADPESDYRIDESLVRSSGKLLVLDRLIPHLIKNGHRALLFSQMTKMIDILEYYLNFRKYKFCRIDGSVAHDERRRQINAFNIDPKINLFLLSTRAGGLGINLTGADTVIIIDSDWNPQMDLQAMDRVHRIGQTRPVIVYRLATANSIDEYIQLRANSKRKLEKIVIYQKQFKGIATLINAENTENVSGDQDNKKSIDSFKSSFTNSNISLDELTEILLNDKMDKVDHDLVKIAEEVDSIPLDKPIPRELIISDENLRTITDRSPEAYNNAYSTSK